MTSKIQYNSVYYVESTSADKFLNPIAIRPTFVSVYNGTSWERRCEWRDTARGGHLFYKDVIPELPSSKISEETVILSDPPREFTVFSRDDEERLKFTYLTAELFKQKVASNPNTYKPSEFKTDQDAQNFYLRNEFPYL